MPPALAPFAFRGTREDVAFLRTPRAIRERSRALYERARGGDSRAFRVLEGRLPAVADYVAGVVRGREPPADRPLHGRMRHFDAGGSSRTALFAERLRCADPIERARAKVDLVLPSVLLDAGAGPTWTFEEHGVRYGRSEGLAVATFRWFMSGELSSTGCDLRCDAEALERVTESDLARAFQARPGNELVGVASRACLLRALGGALRARPDLFGSPARPGHLVDWARANAASGRIEASALLAAVLDGLSGIWPGRVAVAGQSLGDCWPHPALGEGAACLVPFHKLSQWLTLSLVEPVLDAGVEVVGLEELTHLPEYRNGGLLLDLGALELVDPSDAGRVHRIGDPLVVEWRALTVVMLDALAPMILDRLGATDGSAATASLLEGGTWIAGRRAAAERRPGGCPPLTLDSDGTVF